MQMPGRSSIRVSRLRPVLLEPQVAVPQALNLSRRARCLRRLFLKRIPMRFKAYLELLGVCELKKTVSYSCDK